MDIPYMCSSAAFARDSLQANLAEKTKQLKAMSSELALHRQQVADLKLEQASREDYITQLHEQFPCAGWKVKYLGMFWVFVMYSRMCFR